MRLNRVRPRDASHPKRRHRQSILDAVAAERDAVAAELDVAVEKLRQSARKKKDKGFAVADIADLTGLTAPLIETL